ncbi:MAG TPA: TolC family protein [Gammaproteobacteria bacterium]|nr:TolC family protein [Gammaproteobacteria bacterium]
MLLTRIFYVGVCLLLPMATVADVSVSSGVSHATNSTAGVDKIDPALPAFIKQVWAESPAVQGAQAEVDAAQARSDGADRPLHNPSLGLDAERTDINTSSIGLTQTLDWSDKRDALVNIARQEAQAARAAFQEARRSTALEALNALVDFFTAREMQELAEHRTQLMQALVDTAKQRQAAGDVQALDVTLAQVAYSEALMTQAAAESTLSEAEAALQAVSGLMQTRSPSQWPPLPSALALPSAQQTESTAFETLPTLAILRSRMEAARARIGLAQKIGRVDPTLGIRAGREDRETLLGLSLEIPLFVRNNFKAEARAAAHEAVAEEQAYRDAYRRAKAYFAGALARYQNTSRAWSAWLAVGQHAQREQMSLLDQLWQAGELSVTDYLIQAKQNIDTQEAATRLLGGARRAHFAWLAASNQVERWLGLAQQDIETNSGESK